jgi:hypothetical protein
MVFPPWLARKMDVFRSIASIVQIWRSGVYGFTIEICSRLERNEGRKRKGHTSFVSE